jgi:nucleoside-diphosphate-sugar epimerase
VKAKIAGRHFDAVVNFMAFTEEHVAQDIELFGACTDHYVFISSASAYKKPVDQWPIVESTPLFNPFWLYSRNKAACETRLFQAYQSQGFPVTVVRPSHTYDRTLIPCEAGFTTLSRMKEGKAVIVHGDGNTLWTLTHHRDFAVGLIGLLGQRRAVGEAFHITSDEVLSWNQIFTMIADAARVEAKIVHVPSDLIAARDPEWGASLLGDKAHCAIFDNSKIRRYVPDFRAVIPFAVGVRQVVSFYEENPEFGRRDPAIDGLMDTLSAEFSP